MKRNKFSLSHKKLLSCDMGELVPCGLTEVLPGDSIQQATSCFIRFSPMLAPVMHPTHIQLAHWFVPHRLVWEDWEDFITGGEDGNDDSVFPTIACPATTGFLLGSLGDYLGVPTGVPDRTVSALPFRGYALIYNEWYRDQQLQAKLVIDKTSGPDTTTSLLLMNANWEKDYLTTSRPYESLGPQVTIPLGSDAPVIGLGQVAASIGTPAALTNVRETGGDVRNYASGWLGSNLADAWAMEAENISGSNYPKLRADLSEASLISINLIREAFALERYQEARSRFGARYVEYLRYLGVRSSDARLQRPEFLGGGRYPVQYSEVLQTAEGESPVGELRGHGIGAARSNRYRRFFEEHGYIFTFVVVKPKTIYMEGLDRHWSRVTKEDFWQKEFQHIGQQMVKNKEVKFDHATPEGQFGFQDRYEEYRGAESKVSGEFREILDYWHFACAFSTDPALNAAFVKCVPSKEPFAVQNQDTLYMQFSHSIQARRLVASQGTSFIY